MTLKTSIANRYLCTGLSLIELISSVAILGAMSSIAIPSFNNYIEKSKIKSVSLNLRSILSLARQNAISTSKDTYVCELINEQTCNTHRPFKANWSNGWLAYTDINNNAELDAQDTIIRIHKNTQNVGVVFNQRGRLRFKANGSARSAGFYLCSKESSRHILLLYSGRTRTKTLIDEERIKLCLQNIK